ncbi:glycosyltransferase [Methylotetracoccus oryzae]|uniref:glycosyltransferase n=1 Tax=Methylotetracoccus oryzae TaxID=1919059 RepID=UPI001117C7CB|nr:glycosyltransferase family 2 protein [Methylotetracoccus oryzae]
MSWKVFAIMAGVVIGALSVLAAAFFRRGLTLPVAVPDAAVTLVMALTGRTDGLPGLLAALQAQTLKPRRLLIAVESADDPAYRCVCEAIPNCALPIELILAGLAQRAGQKCVNLAAALDRLDAADEFVAFIDADIQPQPWWLSALVSPLKNRGYGVVSGYRWPTIARNTLGAHLILALDRGIATLPRLGWAQAVWGGSTAMRRETIDRLALAEHFRRRLSDDLTIGELARQAGIPVLFRRLLRVPSPLSYTLGDAWRFGRRQYQMVRVYRPQLWLLALTTATLQLACWVAIACAFRQPLAGFAAAVLFGLALSKTRLLDRIGVQLGHHDQADILPLQLLLCVAKPLVDTFHWSMIIAAARVRSVAWGHVTYRVGGPTAIAVVARGAWQPSEH